jgi:hypothetical protein
MSLLGMWFFQSLPKSGTFFMLMKFIMWKTWILKLVIRLSGVLIMGLRSASIECSVHTGHINSRGVSHTRSVDGVSVHAALGRVSHILYFWVSMYTGRVLVYCLNRMSPALSSHWGRSWVLICLVRMWDPQRQR